MKLSYTRLLVEDFDACFEFYGNLLGFSATWGKKGEDYASFDVGTGTMLSIYKKEQMLEYTKLDTCPNAIGYSVVVCFEVEKLDETYEKLKAKGVHFVNEPADKPGWGVRCVHALDPDNHIVEFNQLLSMDDWDDDIKEKKPNDYGK
jgi:lactoylglutathione lyase